MAALGAAAVVGTLLIARTTSQATSEPFAEAPATIASETAAANVAPPEEEDAATPIAVAVAVSPEPESAATSASPPTVAPPEPATAPSQRRSGEVKWTNTWVNVRADRSIDAPVVLTLDPAKAVDVDDFNRGWWAAYVDGKHVGYVANSVLSDQRPTL